MEGGEKTSLMSKNWFWVTSRLSADSAGRLWGEKLYKILLRERKCQQKSSSEYLRFFISHSHVNKYPAQRKLNEKKFVGEFWRARKQSPDRPVEVELKFDKGFIFTFTVQVLNNAFLMWQDELLQVLETNCLFS